MHKNSPFNLWKGLFFSFPQGNGRRKRKNHSHLPVVTPTKFLIYTWPFYDMIDTSEEEKVP